MTKHTSSTPRRALAVAALAAAACAAAPASSLASGAETFCVHQGSYVCPAGGIDEGSDLQAALNNADANSVGIDTPNIVNIGPGTYTSPSGFSYVSTNPIKIVGAGPGSTILTAQPDSASGTYVLAAGAGIAPLSSATATVSGLTLDGVNANGVGLQLINGAANDVAVTDDAAGVTGLNLEYSSVKTASVSVPDVSSVGVLTRSSGSDELDDLTVTTGGFGVRAGAATTLVRANLKSGIGVQGTGGEVRIEDSLVQASSYGLVAFDTAGPGSIRGGNNTIVHTAGGPAGPSYGVYAQATAGNGSDIGFVNSIIRGFTYPFGTEADNGPATIEEASNNYDGTYLSSGVTTTGPIGGDPDFVDPAHGDYHLAASSPLIDATSVKYVTLSNTDLDGNPRVVAVTHPGTPLDLGAYEYQPAAASGGNPGGGTPGTGGGTPGAGGGTPGMGGGTPGTGMPSNGSRPTPPSHHAGRVKLTPLGHITVTGTQVSLRLSCTGSAACSPIKLTATAMRRHHRVTVGSLTTRLSAGHKATLTLRLNRAGRALLAKAGRLAVTLTITVRNGSRTQKVETAHLTLT